MTGADPLQLTLLADGSSDQALLAHIGWLVRRYTNRPLSLQFADLRRLPRPPKALADRIRTAMDLFPCQILLVHRDAERESFDHRRHEILDAVDVAGAAAALVLVIPVRMTEAWLMFDEPAIRHAAGNPNGSSALDLPPMDRVESLPDPKTDLHELLRVASGLAGRRIHSFSEAKAALRIVDYVDDFAPLLVLPAFAALDRDLRAALAAVDSTLATAKSSAPPGTPAHPATQNPTHRSPAVPRPAS